MRANVTLHKVYKYGVTNPIENHSSSVILLLLSIDYLFYHPPIAYSEPVRTNMLEKGRRSYHSQFAPQRE